MVLPNASSQSTVRRRRIQRRLSFSDAPPPLSTPGVSPVPDDAPPTIPVVSALSIEESEEDGSSSSQSDSSASDENTPRTNNSAASTRTLSESQSSVRTSMHSTPNTENTWAAQSTSHDSSDSSDSDEDSSDSEMESEEDHPVQDVLGIVQHPGGGDGSDAADENINGDGEPRDSSSASGRDSSVGDPNPSTGDGVNNAQNVPERSGAHPENGSNGIHPSRLPHLGNERDSDDSSSEDEEEPADSGRRPLIRDNGAYKHTNGFIYESDESNDDGGSSSADDDMFYNQTNDNEANAPHALGSNTGNNADNSNQGDTDGEGNTNGGDGTNDAGSSGNNLNHANLSAAIQLRSSGSRVISRPNDAPSSENSVKGHLDEREEPSGNGSGGTNTDDDDAPEEVQAADAAARALERRAQERRVGQEVREIARTRRRQKVSDGGSNTHAQADADADVEMKENVEEDNTGSVDEELSEGDLEKAAERVERDNRMRDARAQAERLRIQKGRVHRPRSSRRVAGIDVAILSHISSVSSAIPPTGAQHFSATRFLAKEFSRSKSGRVPSARAARSRR